MDPFVLGEGDGPDLPPGPHPVDDPLGLDPASYGGELPDSLLPGEDEVDGVVDDHLWLADGSRVWDLGPADVDTDADGINDSLTRTGPDGMTVYTDSDNDGQVDTVTHIGADGSYDARELDDDGRWMPTDSGRLE